MEKPWFYVDPYKRKKQVIVLTRTFAIYNIDIKFQIPKKRVATQPEIIRQSPFELTDIEYDRIK